MIVKQIFFLRKWVRIVVYLFTYFNIKRAIKELDTVIRRLLQVANSLEQFYSQLYDTSYTLARKILKLESGNK